MCRANGPRETREVVSQKEWTKLRIALLNEEKDASK